MQIIQLASGVVEKRLTFPGRVLELTFTDDGRHLITGNATIYVVRLEPAPTKPSVWSAATTITSPKTLATNPDRRAAEYVLSIGGTINVSENGQDRVIKVSADVPPGEFELTAVNLLFNNKVSDAGLAHFAGCPKLGVVIVKNTKVTEVGVKKLSAALPGCKIEWDGGVIEPKASIDR